MKYLLIWFLLSLPVAIFVGHLLRRGRSFFRCRKCHEVFDGSKSVPQKEVE